MFVKKKWRMMPKLNEQALNQQANVIVNFIKLTHPYLADSQNDYTLELRPVVRGNANKLKPCRISDLTSTSISKLNQFLHRANGQTYCMFYALSAAQSTSRIYNSSETVVGTHVLPMDLDNCTYVEYQSVKDKLLSLGIESVDVFTGHGFQILILLDKLYENKELFKYFTELLLKKGFPVDSQIIDSARFFRLPATFNTKYFDTDGYIYQSAIVSTTVKRYSPKEIFSILHQLPDVDVETALAPEDMVDLHIVTQELINDAPSLPIPVKKMLLGAPEGVRNTTLVFLTRYLNAFTSFSRTEKFNYIKAFGENCKPPLPSDEVANTFYRFSKPQYQTNKIYYPPELGKLFGWLKIIDKPSEYFYIPNTIFTRYGEFKNQSIRLYIHFLHLHYHEKADNYAKSKLLDTLDFRPTTFKNSMKVLTKHKLITKKKAAANAETAYYLTPYFHLDEHTLRLPLTLLPKLLELKYQELYTYLAHVYLTKNSIETNISQEKIAQLTGYTQQNISLTMRALVKKKFISEHKTYLNSNFAVVKYELVQVG